MLNSIVLDVVIGLVFIYLLYSLLATTIQEIIATNFGFRSKILERAIFRMLEDEDKSETRFKTVFDLFWKRKKSGVGKTTSDGFYGHPLMKFLGENKRNSKPAYIDKETFSKIFIDLLRGDQVLPGDNVKLLIQNALTNKTTKWGKVTTKICDETLSYINSIWADAQGDVDKFKVYLENWFDATMERATGWYKKNTQFILLFIGLGIAILFNVDTIEIVKKLEKDPKLREQLVQQADAFVNANPDLDKKLLTQKNENEKFLAKYTKEEIKSNDSLKKINSEDSLNLQNYKELQARRDTLINRADSLIKTDISKANDVLGIGINTYKFKWETFFKSLLGWFITAIAISLGAPFWFDLLNKLMQLRSARKDSGSTNSMEAKPQSITVNLNNKTSEEAVG